MSRKTVIRICPHCKRRVPVRRGIIAYHYIQDKNWAKKDGTKDECEGSLERWK